MIVFAHAGHWLASLAYAAPVLGLLGWLGVIRLREWREHKRSPRSGD